MRVVVEAAEESQQRFIDHRVIADTVLELVELFLPGKNDVEQ